MSKKLLLFFLFITVSDLSQGQIIGYWWSLPPWPYVQLDWPGWDPKWHETTQVKAMISDTCDGYNLLTTDFNKPFVRHEDFLYTTTIIRSPGKIMAGGVVEKRNYKTGDLLWQSTFNHDYTGYGETPMACDIDSSGDLIVYCLKSFYLDKDDGEGDGFTSNSNTRLSVRKFNKLDGSLKSYVNPHLSDTTYSTALFYDAFDDLNSSTFEVLPSNKLKIIKYALKQFFDFDNPLLTSITFNDEGEELQKDTFRMKYYQDATNLARIDKNRYIHTEWDYDHKRIKFNFLDNSFRLLDTVITETLDLDYINIEAASDDRVLIRGFKTRPISGRYNYLLMFDMAGNKLIHSMTDTLTNTANRYAPLKWMTGDDVYILGSWSKRGADTKLTTYADVLKANEIGGFDIVSRSKINDNQKVIEPKILMDDDENNELLIRFRQQAYIKDPNTLQYNLENFGKAVSYARVDKTSLGIGTSSLNSFPEIAFAFYPNPVVDYLNIDFPSIFSGSIEVIDQLGKSCRKIDVDGSNFTSLQCHNLTPGTYYLRLTSQHDKKLKGATFIKM